MPVSRLHHRHFGLTIRRQRQQWSELEGIFLFLSAFLEFFARQFFFIASAAATAAQRNDGQHEQPLQVLESSFEVGHRSNALASKVTGTQVRSSISVTRAAFMPLPAIPQVLGGSHFASCRAGFQHINRCKGFQHVSPRHKSPPVPTTAIHSQKPTLASIDN